MHAFRILSFFLLIINPLSPYNDKQSTKERSFHKARTYPKHAN